MKTAYRKETTSVKRNKQTETQYMYRNISVRKSKLGKYSACRKRWVNSGQKSENCQLQGKFEKITVNFFISSGHFDAVLLVFQLQILAINHHQHSI